MAEIERHNQAPAPTDRSTTPRTNLDDMSLTRPRPRNWILGLAGIAALAALVFFAWRWWDGRRYASTDDAYVGGDMVPVLSRVSGYVQAVNVRENEALQAGQPLVEVDPSELQQRLAQAQAELQAAQANIGGAQSRVDAARATVEQARLQLAYTHIAAPAAGIVAKKSVQVGQLVSPGQALMTVVPMENVWVTANLKETQLNGVNPGDPAEIRIDAYPGLVLHGQVESLSPSTGAQFSLLPPENATGNFTKVVQRVPVRIRLSGNNPRAELRPGMSSKVRIEKRR